VQIKLFDLLYCDAKSYLHESYQKRADKLLRIVPKNPNILTADKIMVEDVEEIDDFFQKMLKSGYEGVIIKSLDGEYQAGTRGWNWIKWKKEYVSEMSDTFDLVVVGAYHGKGRRSGVYGALLCAVYNKKEDIFESICKLGTGLTDEMLEELPNLLKKQIVTKKPARVSVSKEMEPDIWIEPKQVVEVLAAEITVSPYHTLGLALRFPRFVKLREDKKAEQATTRKEIEEMFGKRKK
jgi:DNA ligase-1